jgi:hypothetical protein
MTCYGLRVSGARQWVLVSSKATNAPFGRISLTSAQILLYLGL